MTEISAMEMKREKKNCRKRSKGGIEGMKRTQRMQDNCTLIGASQERYSSIILSHSVKDITYKSNLMRREGD